MLNVFYFRSSNTRNDKVNNDIHCRRQLQCIASLWCAELRRGCQIAQTWETAQGAAADTFSLRHLLSQGEGAASWQLLGYFVGMRAHGLPTLPLQGAARDRPRPFFSQSCSMSPAPIFLSSSLPDPHPYLPLARVAPFQQKEQRNPPIKVTTQRCWIAPHACRRLSNPFLTRTALKSGPLVPRKML